MTEITTSDLNAADEDSPAEDLFFLVTQPSNGHLALKSAPTRPLMNFTQAHIQQGQLLFVHNGKRQRVRGRNIEEGRKSARKRERRERV